MAFERHEKEDGWAARVVKNVEPKVRPESHAAAVSGGLSAEEVKDLLWEDNRRGGGGGCMSDSDIRGRGK